jgi:ABC-type iron transport system FetAB permease component
VAVSAMITFAFLIVADRKGIPKKWVTAAMGTLISFGMVVYVYRGRLSRWSLWLSLMICLAVHCAAIWIVFQYVLRDFKNFSIWFWFPVMAIEVVVLLVVVKRIEERITGRHETIKLDF